MYPCCHGHLRSCRFAARSIGIIRTLDPEPWTPNHCVTAITGRIGEDPASPSAIARVVALTIARRRRHGRGASQAHSQGASGKFRWTARCYQSSKYLIGFGKGSWRKKHKYLRMHGHKDMHMLSPSLSLSLSLSIPCILLLTLFICLTLIPVGLQTCQY